ncbi:hypothetical protein INR49_030449 [Caranx melampygus]|nr:hypothetical protein INR49_030449 [Caranx melampygus]
MASSELMPPPPPPPKHLQEMVLDFQTREGHWSVNWTGLRRLRSFDVCSRTSLPGFLGSGMSVSVYSDSSESVFLAPCLWICLHFLLHPFLSPHHHHPSTPPSPLKHTTASHFILPPPPPPPPPPSRSGTRKEESDRMGNSCCGSYGFMDAEHRLRRT